MKVSLARSVVIIIGIAGFAAGYLANAPSPRIAPHSGMPSAPMDDNNRPEQHRRSGKAGQDNLTADEFIEAFANAATQQSLLHRTHDLQELASKFELAHLPRILQALRNLPEDDASLVLRTFFSSVALKDPQAALEVTRKFPPKLNRVAAMEAVLQRWAHTDEKSALAWTETLDAKERQRCIFQIARAEIDEHFGNPQAILGSLLDSLTLRSANRAEVLGIFQVWSSRDVSAAYSEANAIHDPDLRNLALDAVMRGLQDAGPSAMLAWYRQLPDADRDRLTEDFTRTIAAQDLQAAKDLIASIKDDSRRYRAVGGIAEEILRDHQDSAGPLAALVPPEQSMAINEFLDYWCHLDPKAGLAECARRMDALDPGDPVRKRFESFFKNNYTINAANEKDPQPVAEFLAQDTNPERAQWFSRVLTAWAQRDAADALQWVNAQTDPSVRDRAISGLAEGWAWHGAADAAQWIQTLPAGSQRDAAVAGYARGTFSNDPDGALGWIHTITDRDQQMDQLQKAWTNWRQFSPYEAQQWLDKSPNLSPTERTALKTLPNSRPGN
jgi:hypothetical protein